jgi:DNA polymerase-1
LQGFNVDIKGETFDITLARYLLGEELKNNDECPSYFYLEKELVLKMKDLGVYDLYQNIELPLVNVLFAMENNGMLIDTKELDTLAKDLREELDSISEKVQGLAGERFNLNSPKQLSNILFEKLGLKAFNNKKIINKR